MTLKRTLRLGSQEKITWTPVKVSFSEPPKHNVNIVEGWIIPTRTIQEV